VNRPDAEGLSAAWAAQIGESFPRPPPPSSAIFTPSPYQGSLLLEDGKLLYYKHPGTPWAMWVTVSSRWLFVGTVFDFRPGLPSFYVVAIRTVTFLSQTSPPTPKLCSSSFLTPFLVFFALLYLNSLLEPWASTRASTNWQHASWFPPIGLGLRRPSPTPNEITPSFNLPGLPYNPFVPSRPLPKTKNLYMNSVCPRSSDSQRPVHSEPQGPATILDRLRRQSSRHRSIKSETAAGP
jgi:hypothetical protein